MHRRSDEINSETSIEFRGLDISEDGGFLLVCFETERTSKGHEQGRGRPRLEYRCRSHSRFVLSVSRLSLRSHVLASRIGLAHHPWKRISPVSSQLVNYTKRS